MAADALVACIARPSMTAELNHWGGVTHICIGNLTIIASDNGLLPGRHQAIIWTTAGTLLIVPFGTNFSGILSKIHTISFKKTHFKMSSGKWGPFCFGLNELTMRAPVFHGQGFQLYNLKIEK